MAISSRSRRSIASPNWANRSRKPLVSKTVLFRRRASAASRALASARLAALARRRNKTVFETSGLRERLAQFGEAMDRRDLLEIAILAVAFYVLLRLLGRTRGSGVVRGLGLL